MNVIQQGLLQALQDPILKKHLSPEADLEDFTLKPPHDKAHGHLSTNGPLLLKKHLSCSPILFAQLLCDSLMKNASLSPYLSHANAVMPGFLNIICTPRFWQKELQNILSQGECYGQPDIGKGAKINVEYVSVNPTGPLHPGHGRVAVVADVLANLLAHVGYTVTREYYINDTGQQIERLAHSAILRYKEALGETIPEIPPGHYPGEYLKDFAQTIVRKDQDRWLNEPEAARLAHFSQRAVDFFMEKIKIDLQKIGIRHDIFFSEKTLHHTGALEDLVHTLKDKSLVHQGYLEAPKGGAPDIAWRPVPLLLFRATALGDTADRPLKKANGEWTYFAADVAYHMHKVRRGFTKMINVWGADHGGHVRPLQKAIQALSQEQAHLEVQLCQMVSFCDRGAPLKLSKRSGNLIALKDILQTVGKDAFRFMMLTRKPDSHFEFDVAKVCEQTKDNPVFYVQYAHARACSVFRMAKEMFPTPFASGAVDFQGYAPYAKLDHPAELALIQRLTQWPDEVEKAALVREPHRLATFLYEVAADFHGLWSQGKNNEFLRFLIPQDEDLSMQRLALVQSARLVIATGLSIFGVQPVQEMP